MRRWILSQLRSHGTDPMVVIDPDGVLTDEELEGAIGESDVHRVGDWFELRRAWERYGRHRHRSGPPLVIVTDDPTVASAQDLPYDIDQSSTVRRVRVPGPSDTRAAIAALDDEGSDRAVERLNAGSLSSTDAVLTAAADLPPIQVTSSAASEFQTALRLVDHAQPVEVLELARRVINDPLGRAVLASPPRLDEVQAAWEGWISDPAGSPWSSHMQECRAELIDLFVAGRLTPAEPGSAEVPRWTAVGLAGESPAARAAALLEDVPTTIASFEDWVRAAQWWGEVRSCLVQVNPTDPELGAKAWAWWADTDGRFLAWLRSSYGHQLTRTWANWPASLDKVQPFLAKRRAVAPRLLLVVLDGMGFTQWARIRDLSSVQVARAGGVLAMLPTLTEVSRQSVAAGTLPLQFADSLRSTSKEPQRWASAWSESGATSAWVRIDGARLEELDGLPFGTVDVIGLVLSATDELMHSAELLGDIGLHAGLDAWMQSGVLSTLLARSAETGYETWLTADHGNLAVEPTKEPREGAFVERAGTRARRYGSKALRDTAAVDGIVWDGLPGYPRDEAERLLFAPGRTGWGTSRLSHGGLSLDEVIVPLVQIETPT